MNKKLNLLNDLDVDRLRSDASKSKPFPYFYVDDFLDDEFAESIYKSFPSFEEAGMLGRTFNAAREAKKVQVTDPDKFPDPFLKLNELLQSQEFLEILSYIMDIPDLVADKNLVGGGIHETSSGGRLDVHVDFNFNDDLKLFRRVNILIYFNKDWKQEYGGILDLWDVDVKKCYAEIIPKFNRMACFATSEISYHGVTPLKCPEGMTRKSFAGYYYTKIPPLNWDEKHHTTIFKQRPKEWFREYVDIPADNIRKFYLKGLKRAKSFGSKFFN